MSSFTNLLLVVACAALLQVGCEARHRNSKSWQPKPIPGRRNSNDNSVALGTIKGSNVITLPVMHLSGPDVIIGLPDNCAGRGLELLGSQVIVSNSESGPPVDLKPDDPNDPQSNVAIHCNAQYGIFRCTSGVDVTSYQYCGGRLSPVTTQSPTTSSSSSSENSSASSSKSFSWRG